jgi:ribosome recycling factor
MSKKNKDLFDVIEEVKIKINNIRKNKKQSIKDFLRECENESKKMKKDKELILK